MTQLPLRLKQADYAGWPKALWIERGALTLVLVPQVGGRIMGLRWRDRDLYWINQTLTGQPIDVNAYRNPSLDKHSLGFLLWGGDKTWLAPQDHWTGGLPFLDLDSGSYALTVMEQSTFQVSIKMTSSICRETGVRIVRTVQMNATDDSWTVTHGIENCSDRTIEWGNWGVSMVRRPATVFLPVRSNSPFPEGVKTFETEGDSVAAKSRVVSHLEDIIAVSCLDSTKFKYGVDSTQGCILAVLPMNEGYFLGYLKRFPTFHPEPYGHGCVAEVFNASEYPYLELETHGPVKTLGPGESFELAESDRIVELASMPLTATDMKAIMLMGEQL